MARSSILFAGAPILRENAAIHSTMCCLRQTSAVAGRPLTRRRSSIEPRAVALPPAPSEKKARSPSPGRVFYDKETMNRPQCGMGTAQDLTALGECEITVSRTCAAPSEL